MNSYIPSPEDYLPPGISIIRIALPQSTVKYNPGFRIGIANVDGDDTGDDGGIIEDCDTGALIYYLYPFHQLIDLVDTTIRNCDGGIV